MNKVSILPLSLLVLASAGCSTILTDDEQRINVISNTDENLQVSVDGVEQNVPGIITVKKENKDKVLTVTSEKCKGKQVALNKTIEPTFFANILSGGVLGSTTDYASESMWKYQDSVEISCNK